MRPFVPTPYLWYTYIVQDIKPASEARDEYPRKHAGSENKNSTGVIVLSSSTRRQKDKLRRPRPLRIKLRCAFVRRLATQCKPATFD